MEEKTAKFGGFARFFRNDKNYEENAENELTGENEFAIINKLSSERR